MKTTARLLAFCILFSPFAAVALSSQEVELTIEAGKLGAVGLLGETRSIGFAGNLIDLTATHRKTGFGAEITPFFITLDTNTRESEISIINLTFFHRTFDPNGFSIIGPFVSFNLLEPALDGLLTRAGFRVTWRTPWRYKKRALAPDAAARPLFTICNLEAGAQWRDGPAFFAGLSIDASIPLFLIMKFFVNGARRQAWELNPEFKNSGIMQ